MKISKGSKGCKKYEIMCDNIIYEDQEHKSEE